MRETILPDESGILLEQEIVFSGRIPGEYGVLLLNDGGG
jgi:hypothetical protein